MKKSLVVSLLGIATLVGAQEPSSEDLFVSHVELGYIQTKGNTDTESFNLDGNLKKELDKHNFKIAFDAQYATDSGDEIKNKYKVIGDYLYQFWETLSLGYVAAYKSDKFSGFDYQFSTGPLAKWKAYTTKTQQLSVDASVLYSIDKVKEDRTQTPIVKRETLDYAAVAAALDYAWQMLDNLKFTQFASYRSDIEETQNYFVFSKTAFTSKISDILSAGVSYKIDYVNRPPEGKEKTDRTFSVNLIVDY